MHYLYQNGAERYQFYRIPKILFTSPRFSSLSGDAKILYGLLLDRASLSAQNGWLDEQRRVYIFFSVEEICIAIGCARKKALKLLSDLDAVGLTKRKIRGQGKPTMIYVREPSPEDFQKQEGEKHTPGGVKATPPEESFSPFCPCGKGTQNKTEQSKTDLSQTHSIPSPTPPTPDDPMEAKRGESISAKEMSDCRSLIQQNIDYELLTQERPEDTEPIDEMVELMTETVCSKRKSIRVAGESIPSDIVRSRLLKLNGDHIRFALDCMRENTTKIKNIRQYLLTVLFNAPVTISSYYSARVNHDLYGTDCSA